jgi:uncharacterized protein (TIGR02270 family)
MTLAWAITHQFVEGTASLLGQRNHAVVAAEYSLTNLARLDNRLEAHIDGLRVAGEDGWQLARKELEWKEAGEVFTAAILAFESNDPAKISEVLAIGAATPELARGVVSALGWMEYEQAAPHIRQLCTAASRAHRRIGIAAAAIHRQDPVQPLRDALGSGDPLLRARAARAVGELGRIDLVPLLEENFKSDQQGCRFWSAWSSALLTGYSKPVAILQSIAEASGPFRERAHQIALRRLGIVDGILWNDQLVALPGGLRLAIIGAGILGFPSLIPRLIEWMTDPPLARIAGEAFTMITGIDLAYHDLDTKAPEDFEAGPTEDPDDDNVDLDPDEHLPWPDARLIAQWWSSNEHKFPPNISHQSGMLKSIESAEQVLRTGRQRQRAAAALDLAVSSPGKQLFEVRAPGFRQVQLLRRTEKDV